MRSRKIRSQSPPSCLRPPNRSPKEGNHLAFDHQLQATRRAALNPLAGRQSLPFCTQFDPVDPNSSLARGFVRRRAAAAPTAISWKFSNWARSALSPILRVGKQKFLIGGAAASVSFWRRSKRSAARHGPAPPRTGGRMKCLLPLACILLVAVGAAFAADPAAVVPVVPPIPAPAGSADRYEAQARLPGRFSSC